MQSDTVSVTTFVQDFQIEKEAGHKQKLNNKMDQTNYYLLEMHHHQLHTCTSCHGRKDPFSRHTSLQYHKALLPERKNVALKMIKL